MSTDIQFVRRGITASICSVLVIASSLISRFGGDGLWVLPVVFGGFGLVIGLVVASAESSD